MPIQGLTTGRARFAELGRLRKGAPKDANRPGKDLQGFRFDSPDPIVSKVFTEAYGVEPTQINVYLPHATPNDNLMAYRELRNHSGLLHRCDGKYCYAYDKITGILERTTTPCPCADMPDQVPYKDGLIKNQNKCQPVGRLQVIVPELQRFGYVLLGTTSKLDIIHLSEELQAIYEMVGTLQGIPLVLYRRPEQVSSPANQAGQRRQQIKYMCHIQISPEYAAQKFNAMQQHALASVGQSSYAIPAPSAMALPEPTRTIDMATGEIFDDEPDYEIVGDDENGATFAPVAEPEPQADLEWTEQKRDQVIAKIRGYQRKLKAGDPRIDIVPETQTNQQLYDLGLELAGK